MRYQLARLPLGFNDRRVFPKLLPAAARVIRNRDRLLPCFRAPGGVAAEMVIANASGQDSNKCRPRMTS